MTKESKLVDVLDEDKPIANQKFVCVSFLSPENIIKDKNIFFFNQFLKNWEFTKSIEKYNGFLNFVAYKYNLSFDDLIDNFKEFVESEKKDLTDSTLLDDFKNFKDNNEEALEKEFNTSIEFKTSTRGLKIRGTFPTLEEAELRCKILREIDPNHDVYVGPVGLWMPWEPEAYKTGRVEYLEDELNQLMSEKNKNEAAAKQEFEKRVVEAKRKAIAENKKLAKKSGNKLTQNINKDGQLVGVNNTIENAFDNKDEVTSADIRKELFEGDAVKRGGGVQDAIDRGLIKTKDNIKITEKKD